MKSIRGIVLIMALSLILTGCFRQASEPFESADNIEQDNASENVQETPLPLLSTATEEPQGQDAPDTEITNTPLQVLPTDTIATATEAVDLNTTTTDDEEPTNSDLPTIAAPITNTPFTLPTNTVAAVVQPTNTTGPNTLPTATNATTTQNQQNTNITPTFITPGAVQGQDQNDTGTQDDADAQVTPSANTQLTSTPSGLITPTDFLNPQNLPEQCYYIVRSGDNLFRIGVNNSVTLDELRVANPQIQSDIIQPGDQLIIPLPGCSDDATSDTPPVITTETTPAAPTGQTIHTVSSGETLGQIARRYGTTIDEIVQINNLTNPDRLSIGQQLIIPSQ